MKAETKEIYKCDHCNKLYQLKSPCLLHEVRCVKNPDNNRPCFNCIHLTKKIETIYYDNTYTETTREVDLLYCSKVDTFLYPPKVQHKGNMYETETKENNPMPKTCEFYNDDFSNIKKAVNLTNDWL